MTDYIYMQFDENGNHLDNKIKQSFSIKNGRLFMEFIDKPNQPKEKVVVTAEDIGEIDISLLFPLQNINNLNSEPTNPFKSIYSETGDQAVDISTMLNAKASKTLAKQIEEDLKKEDPANAKQIIASAKKEVENDEQDQKEN